jgi:hypothetical protein
MPMFAKLLGRLCRTSADRSGDLSLQLSDVMPPAFSLGSQDDGW